MEDNAKKIKKYKYLCIVCDGEVSLKYYTKMATSEEVAILLMHMKLCVKHAQKIAEAETKREIERTVA